MNKTVVAVAAILTAGALAVWALGGARERGAGDLRDSAVVVGTGVVTGL